MKKKSLSEKQQVVLWFVRLRWYAIVFMFLILIMSTYLSRLQIPIIPSLLIIGIAALYNLIFPFLVRQLPFFSENQIFTYFRASADILVVTILIHFTGGVESPFGFFYLIEFAAIAVYNFEFIAYILSVQTAAFYWINCILEAYLIIPHYRLVVHPGTLFLSVPYVNAKAMGLFFSSILIIYIVAYLSGRLRDKQKLIETLSGAQVEFMNMVIHETKTPLTSILGYTDLLNDKNPADFQREPLGVIKRQAQRILNMANDLLNLARIESGKVKLNKTDADLREIAEHALEEVEPLLQSHELTMVKEFEPSLPLIKIDEDKIHEVFINLLSNAIKFSDKGGKIFISISLVALEMNVAVRDEGLGIEQKDLTHIFDKFYRASKESAERKGTGLGLALCKSIVEAHGGRIWVVSGGHGQGAVFNFALPMQT
ncbi:MAG: HAMP domain-containing sensor histidine kinase [Candidatus Margulisiibacteriota bacterium]|jgi:signal transduction histidine kinase